MPAGPPTPPPSRRGLAWGLAWGVLGLLLAATLLGAATLDRRDWPGLVGDEAAYLMQAESLAFDLDLVYSRADFDRFAARWRRPPEGLILQSGDRGETLTYGKPALYSAWLAPFVRASPGRGPAIANDSDLLKPDLTAPGVSVLAAVAPPHNEKRKYDVYSGTSMASPHVAGLAAFLMGEHKGWSPMQVKSALMTSAGMAQRTSRSQPGPVMPMDASAALISPMRELNSHSHSIDAATVGTSDGRKMIVR